MANKCRACGLESNDTNNFCKSDDGSEQLCQECFDEEYPLPTHAELEKLFLKLCLEHPTQPELKKLFLFHCLNNENSDEDNDEDSDDEEEVLEDLTCAQLKTRLRAIDKPVGGRKADLIKRIREHERLTAALFEED